MTSLGASVVSGSRAPPLDGTRNKPLRFSANTIVPSSDHAPPREFGASVIVTTAPPVTATFFSFVRVKERDPLTIG